MAWPQHNTENSSNLYSYETVLGITTYVQNPIENNNYLQNVFMSLKSNLLISAITLDWKSKSQRYWAYHWTHTHYKQRNPITDINNSLSFLKNKDIPTIDKCSFLLTLPLFLCWQSGWLLTRPWLWIIFSKHPIISHVNDEIQIKSLVYV